MTVLIEVCIDNIESLPTAIAAGADRIELCGALALGGLTPSAGFIKHAVHLSPQPVYAMVRPRAGDFVFNVQDVNLMVDDILLMKEYGVGGVVIGALTADGDLDLPVLRRLIAAADGVGITFHRAFDVCRAPELALEQLVDMGCERVLTSGLHATAKEGAETIHRLVRQADGRISVMAGAGVNAGNAASIVADTGVTELHLSGKTTRPAKMKAGSAVKMGNSSADDISVDVTSFDKVKDVVSLFR
jgi:copper homeostasis protein